MTGDAKLPARERRSNERVADDADWETKVLARVRGNLRRGSSNAGAADAGVQSESSSNWEEQVAAAVRQKHDKKSD